MAWLTNWLRRKQLYVNGTTAGSQSSYQIKITVNYGTGTDSTGNIYCNNVKSDFSDIRLTDTDGTTLLNYWIESYTASSNAIVWIQIPSIPTGSNSTYIYLYYNNPSATSSSNGLNTFKFFEDFNNNTYRESGWTIVGSGFSLVSNRLHISNFYNNRGQRVYNNNSRVSNIGQNFEIRFDCIGVIGTYDPWLLIGLRNSSPSADSGPGIYTVVRGGGSSGVIDWYYISPSQRLAYGTLHDVKVSGVNSNRFYYTFTSYTGNASLNIYSDSARTINVGSGTYSYTTFTPSIFDCPDNIQYDPANNNYYSSADIGNIIIRNYASPEPTWSPTIGAEQQAAIGTTGIAFFIAGD